MSDLKLTNLINGQTLQQLQNAIAKATGMAVSISDLNNPITKVTNESLLCSSIIAKSDSAVSELRKCENDIKQKAFNTNSIATSISNIGLLEIAIPIVLRGSCIGVIIAGQVFAEEYDDNTLGNFAKQYDIDKFEYINAAKNITVMSKIQAEALAEMILSMISIIISMAYKVAKNSQVGDSTYSSLNSLSDAEQLVNTNKKAIRSLTDKFEQLNNLSENATQKLENISETVKEIQDIAMNTRILGFNASIEASRAKESGKGFGVIAQEVRSLADISKTSAEKIEELIHDISDTTNQMRTTIIETNTTVNDSFETMNDMINLLEKMKQQ